LLVAVAVAAFFLTRSIAANNSQMNARDGAEWFDRGQRALAAGHVDDAIDAFRRAAVRSRIEKRYVLALADALARQHEYDSATSTLLVLRETAPEDPEINLQLARLAAERRDTPEATRYYRNALYAPWPLDQADRRREVRLELIEFLLTQNQPSRALPELLALGSDVPDDPPLLVRVGKLFAKAGDNRRALDYFRRALQKNADNADALAAAGEASFELGDYASARGYLTAAGNRDPSVQTTRELADLVLAHDPLESRLGGVERQRRLLANFAYARQRLNACLDLRSSLSKPIGDERALLDEAQSLERTLTQTSIRETDTIESLTDVIYRIEQTAMADCPPALPLDRALVLIGQRHGAPTR